MTSFYHKIYAKVREIPRGTVASYGQVAKAVGLFRGTQVVGWALRALPKDSDVPWQRVINQKGQISIINPKFPQSLQKTLLEEEGHVVEEKDGYYTLKNPNWFDFSQNHLPLD